MSKKVKKYRLYAIPYSLENVEFASEFRFSRVTSDYILIYTQKARMNIPVGKAAEVKENDISLLSKMDGAWLFDCGLSLFADIAANQSKDSIGKLSEMVSRLEEELEAESRKESDGA